MAAPLATCTKEEQRSVIRFLSSDGVKPIEIHRWMRVQYGDACLSLQQVYERTRKFMNGISSVTDSPRPGQAHPVVTLEAIAAVEVIVKENRHVTVNEIAAHLDMSHEWALHIVHDILQFIYIFKVFIWLTVVYTDYFIGKYYECIIDQTVDFSSASLRQVVFRNHCPLHEVFSTVRIVRYTGTKCGENSGVYNLR